MLRPFDLIFFYRRFQLWRWGLREKYVTMLGHPFRFWEGGTGDPILLIHGLGGGTLQDFGRLASFLVQNHRVISMDLPGFGLSHHIPFEQSVTNQVEFIRDFLDKINVDRCHLLGNSMGGWIALKFAHQYRTRIYKLILTAPAGIRFDPPPLDVFTPNDEAGMWKLISHLFHKPPAFPKWFVREWLRTSLQRRKAVVQMLASMQTEKDLLDDHLQDIHVPTLILWGVHDRLIPASTGERLVSRMPDAQLKLIDTCGHLLLHEDFPAISRCLKTWFNHTTV
jgi:pimeloyl-ACP methyl ester carboxylesterase